MAEETRAPDGNRDKVRAEVVEIISNRLGVGKEQITDLGTLHLTGADAGNYTLSPVNSNDFVIVTKATLTVSAVTQTKAWSA